MDNISSLEEMPDVCRVCLEKSPKMYPLVGPILNVDVDVSTMITCCTSVEIELDEDLPKGVCVPCFRTIRIAYNFISEFKETNKKLLELKDTLKIKRESDYQQESDITVSISQEEETNSFGYKEEMGYVEEEEEEDGEEKEEGEGEEKEDEGEGNEEIILKYVADTFENSNEDVFATSDAINLNEESKIEIQADKPLYYQSLRKLTMYACPFCTKTFRKFESGFVPHLYSHKNARLKCAKCPLETEFELEEYVQHYRKNHLYQCLICNRNFSRRSSQYYHMKFHKEKKIYKCSHEKCKKTFMSSWSLKKHENTHSRSVKYICSKCGREFNTYDTFRYHQKTHDGNRSHLCTQCGRTFLQSVHLKYHMWKHTGIKQFQCKKCNKSYTSVTQLKKHLRKYCGAEEERT